MGVLTLKKRMVVLFLVCAFVGEKALKWNGDKTRSFSSFHALTIAINGIYFTIRKNNEDVVRRSW